MYEEQYELRTPRPRLNADIALVVVALGSLLGLMGAVVQEIFSDFLAVFFAGPIIEEMMKPTGLYLLLLWRPNALGRTRVRIGYGAIAGACFGLIESWVYVNVYVEDPTPNTSPSAPRCPSCCTPSPAPFFAVALRHA